MATRSCPDCGAQYVASVRRCIDCDVVLVDSEVPSAVEAVPLAQGAEADDKVLFELEGWGNQLKVSLEGMLDKAGIRRQWSVGALVVWAEDQESVEALIATVEGRDVDELAEMEEQLAFEIEGLDDEGAADLEARLIAAGVVHAWSDEGELLVALDDEERVTEIIEAVIDGDDHDEVDGLHANQVLSDVYVALDRLAKAPGDNKLVERFVAAAEPLAGMGVPYGFSAGDWNGLKDEVADLAAWARDGSDHAPGAADADADAEGDGDGDDDDGQAVRDAVTDDLDEGPSDDEADEPTDEERFGMAVAHLRERLLDWV